MSDTDTGDKSDPEQFPSFEEFCERYFRADQPLTAWQTHLGARLLNVLHEADQGRFADPEGTMLPRSRPEVLLVMPPPGHRPFPSGRTTVLAAIVSMLRDHDKGVQLLFTSRSEATAQRQAEDMRAAVEELAPAMLGRLRHPAWPDHELHVLPATQPILSAGDALAIVELIDQVSDYREELGLAPRMTTTERALSNWLERWLHPDVFITELPVATDRHPSNGPDAQSA